MSCQLLKTNSNTIIGRDGNTYTEPLELSGPLGGFDLVQLWNKDPAQTLLVQFSKSAGDPADYAEIPAGASDWWNRLTEPNLMESRIWISSTNAAISFKFLGS